MRYLLNSDGAAYYSLDHNSHHIGGVLPYLLNSDGAN
jgi:hypothetical protein